MPTQDDIDQQQQLLAAYRRNLAHELGRAAQYGGSARAPVEVANGIIQARSEIAQIKAVLRGWGEVVENQPGDVETPFSASFQRMAPSRRQRSWFWPLSRQRNDILDPEIDRRNRQVFISDMRRRFAERLESTSMLIPLRLAEHADAVEPPGMLIRPYDIARRHPGQADEVLPARMRIVDLYDEHNAQLLILGAPGAGKTFLLYELAHDLVERAAADESAPVPVIFSLAAWRPGQPLDAWMIADLSRRYGTKPQVIARFVDSGAILPLLDGLDEMDALERRAQCVVAINAYRQSRDLLPPLVVACREREYSDLPPLRLNTALVVQPLAPAQIGRYLASASFEGLRAALARDSELADLARTPLLLGLMAETYRDRAPMIPLDVDATTLRQVVLGDYVAHCCAPRADATALRVPVSRLRAFLAWLARGMIAHNNQQDFYIEFLQPSWLPSVRWLLGWLVICLLLLGTVLAISSNLVFGEGSWQGSWLAGTLIFGAISILIGGLPSGSMPILILKAIEPASVPVFDRSWLPNIRVVETLKWSWVGVWPNLQGKLASGAVGGLIIGSVAGLEGRLNSGPIGWLVFGLMFGLIFGMGSGLIDGFQGGLAEECHVPNQAIRRSMRNALIGVLIFGLGGGVGGGLIAVLLVRLIFGLDVSLIFGLNIGLIIGLLVGLIQFGGLAIIQHYTLRFLLTRRTPAPFEIGCILEDARMRGLLTRVGGGYRFYHELLQRHFAAHEEPGYPHVSILAESEPLAGGKQVVEN